MEPLRTPGELRIGALGILALCFVVSAIVRAGDVIAALPAGAAGPAATKAEPGKGPGGAPAVADTRSPAVLISEMKRQRAKLKKREARLDARRERLEALSRTLRSRLKELKDARRKLAATAALVNDAAGKDVRRLAEMYQRMKPQQAGLIFDRMTPSFAAGFISEMRADAAALILANMQADKAYAVTLLLAGRNVRRKPAGRKAPAK